MNDETYGKLKTFYCGCCVWLPAWPAIHISSANQLKFLAKNKPKLPFLKFHGFDSFQFFISFIKFFLLFFIPTSLWKHPKWKSLAKLKFCVHKKCVCKNRFFSFSSALRRGLWGLHRITTTRRRRARDAKHCRRCSLCVV